MPNRHTLERLSEEYRTNVPDDLRNPSFNWYLDALYEEPRIARNAHQRVADMFDHYGTQYDEERGVVEYALARRGRPHHDGENVFYGREVHEAIHEFVNKVKSGARGLGPEKSGSSCSPPVGGSGKSHFDWLVRRYFEAYTREDAGRMYTFRWVNLCSVIDDQDPGDDTVRSPMNQDPLVLIPRPQREGVIDELNERLDAPTPRNDQHPRPGLGVLPERTARALRRRLTAGPRQPRRGRPARRRREPPGVHRDVRAERQEEPGRNGTHRRRQLREARRLRRVRSTRVRRLRRRVL